MALNAAAQRKALSHMSDLIGQTMEEEILNLNLLLADLNERLPLLFADSVMDSLSTILGDATAETLIRHIGEDYLQDPSRVYAGLDEFLRGGSEFLKWAIQEELRVKVHKLYMLANQMVMPVGARRK
jgi:hypothetical protein